MAIPTTTTTPSAPVSSDSKTPVKAEASSPASAVSVDANSSQPQAVQAQPPKRKPARRANTAERRATHNAVERMRRETLNGRFLTLASLLPPLAALRRPSKAAIVGSSIATVHAARRHRVLAAQTLRALSREAEGLRREVNEWRARARVPALDAPPRSDAHAAVLRAELEDFDLSLEDGLVLEEEGDEEDDGEEPDNSNNNNAAQHASSSNTNNNANNNNNNNNSATSTVANRARSMSVQTPATPYFPDAAGAGGLFAFEAPPRTPSSPSSDGSEGPGTPPASAGVMGRRVSSASSFDGRRMSMSTSPQALAFEGLAPMGMPMTPMQMQMQMQQMQQMQMQIAMGKSGYEFDGGASAMGMGMSMSMPMSMPAMNASAGMKGFDTFDAPAPMGMHAGYDLLEESTLLGMGIGGNGNGWARGNPQHPAFHAQQAFNNGGRGMGMGMGYEAQAQAQVQQQQMMAMGMGGGVGGGMYGVQSGQYLHQPTRFA